MAPKKSRPRAPARETNSNHTVLFPLAVVDWRTAVTSANPAREASRSQLRSLRDKGLLSHGVKATHRGRSGLAGSGTFYSTLWVWANRCAACGLDEPANQLRLAALAVEKDFADPLSKYLVDHGTADLPQADFYPDLCARTAKGFADCGAADDFLHESVLVAGLAGLTDFHSRVVGREPSGRLAAVDVPQKLLDFHGVDPGATLWVVRYLLGHVALVDVDLVVPTVLPKDLFPAFAWASVANLRSQLYDVAARSDEPVASMVYQLTAGASPADDYWDDLVADVRRGALPVRTLRVA